MTFVDECRREWKRLGVPDALANEMAAELAADLAEAEAEGASPEDVLGHAVFDPRALAASWAEERGVVGHEPPRRPSVPVGVVVALALSLVIIAIGVAALGGFAHTSVARVAVGANAQFRIHRMTLVPPPNRPLSSPPATAGLVFLGIGLGGAVATLATWWLLDRRRRIIS